MVIWEIFANFASLKIQNPTLPEILKSNPTNFLVFAVTDELNNISSRDSRISFNEADHSYVVDGKTLISVTTLIDNYFERFDPVATATKKAHRLGIDPEVLINEWKHKGEESRQLGTELHANIERYYKGNTVAYNAPEWVFFLDFARDYNLEPIRSEWTIFDEDYGVAGTLDFICRHNGELTLFDWKRSEKLIDPKTGIELRENRFHRNGHKPISHVSDTPYYRYALQVNMYAYFLSEKYGIEVKRLKLAVFHPTNSQYYVIELPIMRKEVIDILKHHKANTK